MFLSKFYSTTGKDSAPDSKTSGPRDHVPTEAIKKKVQAGY